MNRKNKFLSAFFSLAIFFVCSLLFCACGSSVDMSSVKSADDIEREKNVSQYKPQPKKEEPKPQPIAKEPTRKTSETKPTPTTPTTSTPEPKRVETSADVPSFSRVAPESRFKFIEKYKENAEQGKYTSSNYYTSYKYNDFGNFSNDGWYKDSSGVAEKFVNLLVTKYPFKLHGHFTDDKTKEILIREEGTGTVMYPEATYYNETWTLNYTGSKNIKKHWVYGENLSEIYGHVHVTRRDYLHENEIKREYKISISDGLTYEE